MKKFISYILCFLLPIFVGIPLVNYLIDPGNVYSTAFIDKVIDGLRQGKNVANVTDLNERVFKEKYIQTHRGESFDYAIIGASRVMTISEDALHASVLNLGMSGSKIEDLIAIYEACKENDIKYKNIIIGVEATFFNAGDTDTRWKSLEKYFKAFTGDLSEETDYSLFKNLFSASYFKSSIATLPKLFKGDNQIKYVDSYINDGATKRIDGSIYYEKEYRDRPQTAIDREAKTWMHGSFKDFNSLSKERQELFDKLILALRNDGVNILFFKGAYHPFFYNRIIKQEGMVEGFDYIDNYAKKNGFKIISSFNPDDIGFKNIDFYDAAHARKESIDSIFFKLSRKIF